MDRHSRRRFLKQVGCGAVAGILGPSLASDLGIESCRLYGADHALTFGDLEPLVALMQETPLDRFLPRIVEEARRGTSIPKLVSAAALANVRAFGGEDYIGYHSFMALVPALAMAGEEPSRRQLLPVLKVLYRNAKQIQDQSAHDKDAIAPIEEGTAESHPGGEELRRLVRERKLAEAERMLDGMVERGPKDAFCAMQPMIQDDLNVHRVVLVWRAWSMVPLAGPTYAKTLLRQSVRFCVDHEENMVSKGRPAPPIRQALPKLLDQYRLEGKALGRRQLEDNDLDGLARTIHLGSSEEAAEAVASALAEGFEPTAIADAISMASCRLVLADPGRKAEWASPNKPAGSVHGDSVGVHASDSANAWRNIAAVDDPKVTITSLIAGAYHTGGSQREPERMPYPMQEDLTSAQDVAPGRLLDAIDSAIRNRDQRVSSAIARSYVDRGLPVEPLFAVLRRFAISEDGALHAEKYFNTVREEYSALRPAFRGDQIVALARVTASEFGYAAPGMEEAEHLLG